MNRRRYDFNNRPLWLDVVIVIIWLASPYIVARLIGA